MGQRQCEKCGETADEARAFCPGCGTPFEQEEKRRTTSEFEMVDQTVKLGHSMYNQMLSEMDLDLSKPAEKRIETVAPAAPAEAAKGTSPSRPTAANSPNARSALVWLIGLAVAVLALAFIVVAVAVVIFYLSAGRT